MVANHPATTAAAPAATPEPRVIRVQLEQPAPVSTTTYYTPTYDYLASAGYETYGHNYGSWHGYGNGYDYRSRNGPPIFYGRPLARILFSPAGAVAGTFLGFFRGAGGYGLRRW